MPVSKEYREKTEAKISKVLQIRSKAMFGGVALYANELIFAILDDDRMWFKADDLNRADFEAEECEQWRPMPSAPPMGYFELPSRVVDDPAELTVWIEKSLAVAERKEAAKSKKNRKR
jgi:DNA transformation protein